MKEQNSRSITWAVKLIAASPSIAGNLLLLVPLLAYLLFRRKQPRLTSRSLLACAVFALSFGFVEGAVAIYLGISVAGTFSRTLGIQGLFGAERTGSPQS